MKSAFFIWRPTVSVARTHFLPQLPPPPTPYPPYPPLQGKGVWVVGSEPTQPSQETQVGSSMVRAALRGKGEGEGRIKYLGGGPVGGSMQNDEYHLQSVPRE